jgi:uncharacterized membrane protein
VEPDSASSAGLVTAVFIASLVEFVEAFTIVLAIGITRGWRSAIAGVIAALATLPLVAVVVGSALLRVPESLFQLVIGALLLIFGLQWLRKAILRSAGLKATHDEDEVFRRERELALATASDTRLGLDWFAFVVSFKAMFLEGLEVVFIVLTFGLTAGAVGLASTAAAIAAVIVLIAGILVHKPMSRVPENTLKFAVGVLITTFGSLWAIEGLGLVRAGSESLSWPGGDLALPSLLVFWLGLSLVFVRWLRASARTRVVEEVAL